MSTKNFFIVFLVSIFFCSGGLITWKQKNASYTIHECDNLFTYVYPAFKNKLLAVLNKDNDLDKSQSKLAQALLNPMTNLRGYHENWVEHLRESIKREKNEQVALTEHLCSWLFLGADLNEEMQVFLNQRYAFPSYHPQLGDLIKCYHQEVFNDKALFNPHKAPTHNDEFGYGNLPSYLFSLSDTHVIRTPNCAKDIPFIRSLFLKAQDGVQEEFLGYITSLKHQRHVYVNLMKRHGKEGSKSAQLERFERTQPSLILVTLDKDSDFYWQNAEYSEKNNAAEFKENFLTNLFVDHGHYYWSSKLDQSKWKKAWEEIISGIHHRYFEQKSTLDKRERQDFIELCYLEFAHYLIDQFQPLSINLSCKQSMDRGPSLTALLFGEELIKQKQLENNYKKLLTMLFAPPILVHNRHSHTSRIDRFVSTFKRIKNNHEKGSPI
ncbi:MAG: hypothetical protein ACSNEK_03370 [Parachlamydiaceae bacterium]